MYTFGVLLACIAATAQASEVSPCISDSDRSAFGPALLGRAMNAGDWKCAKEVADVAQTKKMDLRNEFDVHSRMIQKELSTLKAAVDQTGPKSHISPAFRWAQSTSEIYVGVKFAHKLDAPMTSKKVDADNVTVTDTMVYLHASDPAGNKNFYLEIPLFGEVVPENSTWSMGSVGRMTLILSKKKSPSKWPRLLSHKKKVPNMHFWFEIDEQYSDALDELKAEKDVHDLAPTASETLKEVEEAGQKIGDKTDKIIKSTEEKPVEISPAAAALLAEKEAINKDLKTKMAELDEEIRKRKNAQDVLMREAKANIDKEIDALKEEARQAAAIVTSDIDAKLGAVLNSASNEEL